MSEGKMSAEQWIEATYARLDYEVGPDDDPRSHCYYRKDSETGERIAPALSEAEIAEAYHAYASRAAAGTATQDAGDSKRRWMKLPPNPAYPHFDEIHLEDDWCKKAGCRPYSGSFVMPKATAAPAGTATDVPQRILTPEVVENLKCLRRVCEALTPQLICQLATVAPAEGKPDRCQFVIAWVRNEGRRTPLYCNEPIPCGYSGHSSPPPSQPPAEPMRINEHYVCDPNNPKYAILEEQKSQTAPRPAEPSKRGEFITNLASFLGHDETELREGFKAALSSSPSAKREPEPMTYWRDGIYQVHDRVVTELESPNATWAEAHMALFRQNVRDLAEARNELERDRETRTFLESESAAFRQQTLALLKQVAELRSLAEKREAALRELAQCDFNEDNCDSLLTASLRVRKLATEALASAPASDSPETGEGKK